MPKLSRITVYPIKSLDGYDVDAATVLPSAALENDRHWAIMDAQGRFLNGKRTPTIHPIRLRLSGPPTGQTLPLTLAAGATEQSFQLPEDALAVSAWLSDALQTKCRLIENADGGFPDDGDAPGPTLISTASLAAAAQWFDGLDEDQMRHRIRANLEIDAPAPFWEDQLADAGVAPRRIAVGPIVLRGRTICMRCIVPTRDWRTGESIPGFARTFASRRQESLPAWSPADQFDHFYRLAINTSPDWIPDGAVVRLGDDVQLVGRL